MNMNTMPGMGSAEQADQSCYRSPMERVGYPAAEQETTSMQRLRERVDGTTEALRSLEKALGEMRNRLGGTPPPNMPTAAAVAPMGPDKSPDVVGIISLINDGLTKGEVALNGIDEIMRSLRKMV